MRAKASKAEEDLEWLTFHQNRLATIVARQCLHELLPDGTPTVDRRASHRHCMMMSHIVLFTPMIAGDYSEAQLMRVNRQALVLHRYYELLATAITRNQEDGAHYLVVSLGAQAGRILGDDWVAVSTVRYWHAEYHTADGFFRADERGHYTRELLVMEEDVNRKFVKWSLKKAKDDDLSVESAQEFLNNELLCSLEVCASRPRCAQASALSVCLPTQSSTLKEYNMKLPISRATTWRWMQSASIYRDKYKQSYYNDKHQDPQVVADRARYIQVMDNLMLRQPLWLQLSMHEFWVKKDRMPADGLLVHHYDLDGVPMVEVHVDLDDAFDAQRAALPLGGNFSVRFPGKTPSSTALRTPPACLPSPGAGTEPEAEPCNGEDTPTPNHATDASSAPHSKPLPSVAAVKKMKKADLINHLQAFGLPTTGLKDELCARLLDAVQAKEATTAARTSDDDDGEEEEEWKVKKIIGRRTVTNIVDSLSFDVIEYQVQWDFPDESDPSKDEVTWEAESNLTNAVEALHEFLASQPKQAGCAFGHLQGGCRCALPLIHAGQDESIFKAYQKSAYQWVVNGVRGLRKKTDGPGEMVSGFKDELRGFGHPLTHDELQILNAFRKARGRKALSTSPAVRFLSYGKNKEGYWTYEHFREQVEDILDMYESLYPNAQVLVEVDWSSGHSKHREDALNVSTMGVNFGGKQLIPHPSKMEDGCLGEGASLKIGELQYFYFRSAEERRSDGATDGKPDPPPFYKPDLQPADYVGLAKGKKQVLHERGLWKAGMVEHVDEDDPKGRDKAMSMDYILSACPDFYNETSALQTLVELRGHILVMSPKGHCELAGVLSPLHISCTEISLYPPTLL